jgi:hypothetical protein
VIVQPAELIAVVDLVGKLLPRGFHRLDIVVPSEQALPLSVLLQLAKLQGLPELRLLLVKPSVAVEDVCDVEHLLTALSGIGSVVFKGLKSEIVDECVRAKQRLADFGLPCVKTLTVNGVATS